MNYFLYNLFGFGDIGVILKKNTIFFASEVSILFPPKNSSLLLYFNFVENPKLDPNGIAYGSVSVGTS